MALFETRESRHACYRFTEATRLWMLPVRAIRARAYTLALSCGHSPLDIRTHRQQRGCWCDEAWNRDGFAQPNSWKPFGADAGGSGS